MYPLLYFGFVGQKVFGLIESNNYINAEKKIKKTLYRALAGFFKPGFLITSTKCIFVVR